MPQVEVTFDVDANGILNVKAKEKTTNKEQSIRIEASSSLSKEDIEKMKKDAEMYAAEDEKKKDQIITRNEAESLVYSIEKMLEEYKDKVDKETISKIQKEMNELKETLAGNNIDQIKAKLESVKKVSQELGMKIYEHSAKEQADKNAADAASKVVDAEVVGEKDKK
jgi:molecular chaperone DnaK